MKILEDLLFLIGFLFIIVPTFLLNVYVGCYVLGTFFLVFAFLFATRESPKRE